MPAGRRSAWTDGAADFQHQPGRKGSSLSCRGEHHRVAIRIDPRPFACLDLGKLARPESLSRHGLDAAAVQNLRSTRDRPRGVPLSGVRPDRQRRVDRSGVSKITHARHHFRHRGDRFCDRRAGLHLPTPWRRLGPQPDQVCNSGACARR